MKSTAVLACRLESTRLFGKPMQLINDMPIILHLISRLRKAKKLDEIVLAISDEPGQHVFIDLAKKNGLRYVIGDQKDVLGRLIKGGDLAKTDIVVRTTTENPYVYWENLDELISLHIKNSADITVTEHLPLGAFLEVISLSAMKRAHNDGEDRHRSELCTLYISENPDKFKIQKIKAPEKLCRADIRLTVDTPQDLILVRTIWEKLHAKDPLFSISDIIELFEKEPGLKEINASNNQTLYLWK
ncbi:MAG: acylneuraminate cytidylyltransferase [Candidatus Margulisiibacteriota bacterium]